MPKIDACEHEVLTAFEKGQLKSVATKAELAKFKAAARHQAIKPPRDKAPCHVRQLNVCFGADAQPWGTRDVVSHSPPAPIQRRNARLSPSHTLRGEP